MYRIWTLNIQTIFYIEFGYYSQTI